MKKRSVSRPERRRVWLYESRPQRGCKLVAWKVAIKAPEDTSPIQLRRERAAVRQHQLEHARHNAQGGHLPEESEGSHLSIFEGGKPGSRTWIVVASGDYHTLLWLLKPVKTAKDDIKGTPALVGKPTVQKSENGHMVVGEGGSLSAVVEDMLSAVRVARGTPLSTDLPQKT